jgi:NAD(P)-dependent dehydrogenase (short-subunit alcohol dehydrogenase family)
MNTQPPVDELFDITGRVALVTGGARNLGFDREMAVYLAAYNIRVNCIRPGGRSGLTAW